MKPPPPPSVPQLILASLLISKLKKLIFTRLQHTRSGIVPSALVHSTPTLPDELCVFSSLDASEAQCHGVFSLTGRVRQLTAANVPVVGSLNVGKMQTSSKRLVLQKTRLTCEKPRRVPRAISIQLDCICPAKHCSEQPRIAGLVGFMVMSNPPHYLLHE